MTECQAAAITESRMVKDAYKDTLTSFNPCLPHFSGVTRLPHMGPEDPGEKNRYKKERIAYIYFFWHFMNTYLKGPHRFFINKLSLNMFKKF